MKRSFADCYVNYIFEILVFLSGTGFEDFQQNTEHGAIEDF